MLFPVLQRRLIPGCIAPRFFKQKFVQFPVNAGQARFQFIEPPDGILGLPVHKPLASPINHQVKSSLGRNSRRCFADSHIFIVVYFEESSILAGLIFGIKFNDFPGGILNIRHPGFFKGPNKSHHRDKNYQY
jgi:hypothetical protein